MKKIIILTLLLLIGTAMSANAAAGLISYGGEDIVKVIDFPDDERFQLDTGEYLDIGYIYKSVSILFIPVWNYDGRLVLMAGNNGSYMYASYQEMNDILTESGNEYPEGPYLDFWQRIGGKVVFAIALLLLIIKLVKKFKNNKRNSAFLSTLATPGERLKDILLNGQQLVEFDIAELGLSITDEEDKTKVAGLEFFAFRTYFTSLISVSIINMNNTTIEQLQAVNDEFFERLLPFKKLLSAKVNATVHYVYFTFDKSPSEDDVALLKALKKRKISSGTHLVPAIIDFEKQDVNLTQAFGAMPSKKVIESCFIEGDDDEESDETVK
jgi:hypothetical protein